jgi:hypothetical protein
MDLNSNNGMPELIREIAWNFGARGLQGECCGGLLQPEFRTLCLTSEWRQCSMQEIASCQPAGEKRLCGTAAQS